MSVTVERKTIDKYTIRDSMHGLSWSIFTLDDEVGDLTVQSDWGNFSYVWGARGKQTLKEFLVSAEPSYIKDKFSYPDNGGKNHVYEKDSLESLRMDIIRARRDHSLSKEYARAFWKSLSELDFHGDVNRVYHSIDMMQEKLDLSYDLDLYEDGPWSDDYDIMGKVVVGCSPQLNVFMERVWPVFIDTLKKEIGK